MLHWKRWGFRLLNLNWLPWSMNTFVSVLWKAELWFFFFLWLMSRANRVTLYRNQYEQAPYVLVMQLAVLVGRRGALHWAPFFNRSALSPCGHRSKATMGLIKNKKKNQSFVLMRERQQLCPSAFLWYSSYLKKVSASRFLIEEWTGMIRGGLGIIYFHITKVGKWWYFSHFSVHC